MHEAMASVRTHGEMPMASDGEKSRKEPETALAGMAEGKCSAMGIITAAAGQVAGQEAVVLIQNGKSP